MEETVWPLIIDDSSVKETPEEQNGRLEELLECKALAAELQERIAHDRMPMLPDRVAVIMKKIQDTLNQKLH